MNKVRTLVVEDELIIAKSLEQLLQREGYDCRVVRTGEEALELLPVYEPDVILMDIGLDGKLDGITTASIIKEEYGRSVIFITEHNSDRIFQRAKWTGPYSYITKPFSGVELLRAVALAVQQLKTHAATQDTRIHERVEDGVFVFSESNGYEKVFLADILYLKASGSSTILHCDNGKKYTISLSSNNVIARLNYPAMMKVNRSFYVNIQKINAIKSDEVIIGDAEIPVSKENKEELLRRIRKISKNR